MIPTPNYSVPDLAIDVSTDGTTWTSVVEDMVELTISRSVAVEGVATSPDSSTATLVTSKTTGADYTGEYGQHLRVQYGVSTVWRGIIREVSRTQTPDREIQAVADVVTLGARDLVADLLKRTVTVTIPIVGDEVTHGELVESVCDDLGIDITVVDADLIVGGPKPVVWHGSALEFLRKMAISCHARFLTSTSGALYFQCAAATNTLYLDAAGSDGYAEFDSISTTRDVDNFTSRMTTTSITGAQLGARKTTVTEHNERTAETFCSGPRLTEWLAQCVLEASPPTLPNRVVSRDIENLHVGLIDPGEDALIILGEDSYYCAVIGIEHRISPTLWEVTYDLANPATVFADYGAVEYADGITGDITSAKPHNTNPSTAPGGTGGGAGSVDDSDAVGGGGGDGSLYFTAGISVSDTWADALTIDVPAGAQGTVDLSAYIPALSGGTADTLLLRWVPDGTDFCEAVTYATAANAYTPVPGDDPIAGAHSESVLACVSTVPGPDASFAIDVAPAVIHVVGAIRQMTGQPTTIVLQAKSVGGTILALDPIVARVRYL